MGRNAGDIERGILQILSSRLSVTTSELVTQLQERDTFMTQPTTNYYTVPKLAERLGIASSSVLDWIKRGHIEEPPILPVTRVRGYSLEAADRIAAWYLQRVLDRKTRGPGAKARRMRFRLLSDTQVEEL